MAGRSSPVLPEAFGAFEVTAERPIARQVYDVLREGIVAGRLGPGTALSEAAICRLVAVSRQPVREALLRLGEEGLVRIYPQRGSIVTPISIPAARRAQVIREAVEVEMVRRVAGRVDALFLADLSAELDRQDAMAAAGDVPGFFASDQAFHRAICERSGTSGIWESLDRSRAQLDRLRHLDLADSRRLDRLIAQHRAVRDALAAGDAAAATDAMRQHLRRVLQSLELICEATPHLVEDADDDD